MKVLFITLHSINNPGSALQAFALNRFLQKNGIENEIIDYRPPYSKVGRRKFRAIISSILFFPSFISSNRKYSRFMKQNMTLTEKTYRKYSSLLSNPPQADVYMTGSDQLWNTFYDCGRDDSYYLRFVAKGKKVAYSTSVGKSDISDNELSFIIERIKDFEMLSLREKSTCELFQSVLNKPVRWVCDPVLLLPASDYDGFQTSLCKEKYAVVYLSEKSDLLEQVIARVREELGLSIIQAGGLVKRCSCDKLISAVGPEDFISLIKNAELVISSSFHATAFSLLLHKNFISILPGGNGERIISILELSHLKNKIVNSIADYDAAITAPDYKSVDELMCPFIKQSQEFLLSIVQ